MNKSRIMGLVLVFSFIIGLLSVSVLARASDRINFAKGIHAYNNHDYITAAKLFKKACDNPDSDGCGDLGALFFNGQGVRRNLVKSYYYFYLTKEFGDIHFQGDLDQLCSEVPSVCIPSNRY